MHMLNSDELRAAVSYTPQSFDLGCVGAPNRAAADAFALIF